MKAPTLPNFSGLSPDLRARIESAVAFAHEAGLQTLTSFQSPTLAIEIKSDFSPVTIADRNAETLLRARIEAAFPADGILGEEHGEKVGTSGWRWILDPIDGTVNFMQGVPLYGTLVGIEHEGESVAGVIFIPGLSEMVFAANGGGAWWVRGDQAPVPAHVTKTSDLSKSVFCFTSPKVFSTTGRKSAFDALSAACLHARGYPDAYGYVLIATGRADIMVDPIMHTWDNGPLLPVIREAGGIFSGWDGRQTIHSPDAVATNGALHKPVLEILNAKNQPSPLSGPKLIGAFLGIATLAFTIGIGSGFLFRTPRPISASATTSKETSFSTRLLSSIAASSHLPVEYTDSLGDGEAAWDKGPLYPSDNINCETWLQKVLADTYAQNESDPALAQRLVMSRLRYFGSAPGFGTRKHHPLAALAFDAGPLKPINLGTCPSKTESVKIGFDQFKKSNGYTCPLFQENSPALSFNYFTGASLEGCLQNVGPLVAYAVPTDLYMSKYGKSSGPMGLVHGLILTNQSSGWVVHHASITSHKVEALPLKAYIQSMKSLHKGYAVYELNSDWDSRAPSNVPEGTVKPLLDCEQALVNSGARRTTDFRR